MGTKKAARQSGDNGTDGIIRPFHRSVNKKPQKYSPWYTWRHREQIRKAKMEALLLDSTPDERARIQRVRFCEVPVLREQIMEL